MMRPGANKRHWHPWGVRWAWPKKGDYARVFTDGGSPVAALLEKLEARYAQPAETGSESTSAGQPLPTHLIVKLLTAFRCGPAFERVFKPVEMPAPSAAVLQGKEPLSNRERSVLGLIAAGLSTDQIARELGVSTNTIKNAHQEHLQQACCAEPHPGRQVGQRIELALVFPSPGHNPAMFATASGFCRERLAICLLTLLGEPAGLSRCLSSSRAPGLSA